MPSLRPHRRLLVAFPLAVAAVATMPAARALPTAGTVTRRFVDPDRAHVAVLAGVLSAPSTRPVAEVAQRYLATRPEPLAGVDPASLHVERTLTLARGAAAVKFRQMHAGLEVVGGTVAVRVDDAGRVRWIRSSAVAVPEGFSTVPVLAAGDAVQALLVGPAAHHAGVQVDTARHTQLVIYAAGRAAPRLAWLVLLPRNVAYQETLRAYVDARTGAVLFLENLVKRDRQANVFEFNPAVSTVGVTTLDHLSAGATLLEDADMVVKNCVDKQTCMPVNYGGMMVNVHFCEMEATATADASGDFTAYTRPATDTEPEDEFSEVQMYYHTTKVYERFRTWGFVDLNAKPMTAIVNLRIPPLDFSSICLGSTSTGPLNPMDNAAFMPAGSFGGAFPPADWIVFGQGTSADFAYDGDVVYHEFTHAVMGTVSGQLQVAVPDAYGLDPTPGGMMEGYSDYFSAVVTGDPEMGEYAGVGLSPMPLPSGAIRSLENTKVCPNDLWGEVHQDGEPWAGALWDIRQALPAGDRDTFDGAVYAAMAMLGANDSGLTAAALTVAEVEVALGAGQADMATAAFAARGYDDCNNRVVEAATKDLLFLMGTDQAQSLTLVPGPLQFKLNVAEDATEITVGIFASQPGGLGGITGMTGQPGVKLLVKAGDEPILWNWSTGDHDATAVGDVTFATSGNRAGSGAATGAFPAGTYHVMLANTDATWIVQAVSFDSTPGNIQPDAGPMPDAAPVTSPDAGPAVDDGGGDCGCRVASQTGLPGRGLALLAAFALLGLVFRRRRG